VLLWIETAIVWVINSFLAGIAALLTAAIALLPNFPDLPSVPAPLATAYGWIAWVFPVGTLIGIFTFVASAWLLWQAVAIALRWLKALDH
jgi:hypothetical protein